MNHTTAIELEDAPRIKVIRTLKQWIEEGVLMAGQPIPSERILSERLNVARGTVRRALVMLDDEGVLRSSDGRTRVVTQFTQAAPVQPVRHLLMHNAVIMVARSSNEAWTNLKQSGWSDYVAHGANHALRQSGRRVITLSPEDFASLSREALVGDRPAGIVLADIMSGPAMHLAEEARLAGIPVVVYGGGPETAGFDRVISDHVQGGYLLTNWLLEQGKHRPLIVWSGSSHNYWYGRRRLGYERAMRDAGLPALPTLTFDVPRAPRHSEDAFVNAVAVWAEQLKPQLSGGGAADALMVNSDGAVPYAAAACRRLGLEPQRAIPITGYDNYWADSFERQYEAVSPAATVDKLNLKLGEQLVSLLYARIRKELPDEPQCRVLQPDLIVVEGQGIEPLRSN